MIIPTCTPFPTQGSGDDGHVSGDTTTQSIYRDLKISADLLFIAWAKLLWVHTGHEELVFISDGFLVSVDSNRWTVKRLPVGLPSGPGKSNYTGVFLETEPHWSLLLCFQYDVAAGIGYLRAGPNFPLNQLQKLHLQLREAIQWSSALKNMPKSTGMQPESQSNLSILNPHPELLQGPRFLDQLVNQCRSQRCAIDFLEVGGNRRQISYQSLHSLSDGVADRLSKSWQKRQKNKRIIVPVLIPQSPELYIALLGILKAGAAFCPLQLDAPEERLKFIIGDVAAGLVVTTSALLSKMPETANLDIMSIDTILTELDGGIQSPDRKIQPTDLAYVMYTSGSTGTPKGVGVSHLAASQSLLAHDSHIPPFSRFLQFASPTFDVFVFETFFPLFRGCTLVGCNRQDMLSDLPAVMNRMNIDAAELTPTVAGTLLGRRRHVPGLRLLLTIGEMLTSTIVQEFGGDSSKDSILWAMYGPTEAAIHCSLQPSFQTEFSIGNIGFPLSTVSCFIAEPPSDSKASTGLQLLPYGETGELVLGGYQLADGYLNRPEQTSASFISDEKFGRLYRTGDKARMKPDGTIECLGRIATGQVKLRGQRIELGEIEQAVYKVPGCRSVAASVIEGTLIVFVLVEPGNITTQDILDACKRWLPSFMVPGDIVILDEMPQLPSGKVDRKRLQLEYESRRLPQPHQSKEAFGHSEREIIDIVEEALGCSLGDLTDLAASGLDSLRAIRVASRLRACHFSVTVADVLSAKDTRHLLTIVQSKRGVDIGARGKDQSFAALDKVTLNRLELTSYHLDIARILPATPLQVSMLAETAANPEAYCNWIEVELSEQHNYSKIKQSLQTLAAENEILRSGFVNSGEGIHSYFQIIWKDLASEQIQEVGQFEPAFELGASESLLRPFKCQVLLRDVKPRILFQIHHALYDGWSTDLIFKDLGDILDGKTLQKRPQFSAVNEFYSTLQNSGTLKDSEEYWKRQLKDYIPTPLPNFNGRVVATADLSSISRTLSFSLNKLRQRAAVTRVSPQVFFQSALAYLLGSYLGTTDVVFGSVTSGRSIPVTGVEEIVGPCIATLPIRVDFTKVESVKELLEITHDFNRNIIDHCTVPLGRIKRLCDMRPGTPLFDVLIVWQETLQSFEAHQNSVRQVDSADRLEFKATIELEPREDSIGVKLTYWPSVMPASQADMLLQQLEELAAFFIDNVDEPYAHAAGSLRPSCLSIVNSEPECQHITTGPAHAVERRAEENPDDVALSFNSIKGVSLQEVESLTYRQLNSRANQLAHALMAHGACPGGLIGIWMEKSVELYLSILAVLKTGSGYLPITPETPRDRINLIFKEANIKLCISQSSVSGTVNTDVPLTVLDIHRIQLCQYSHGNLAIPYNGSDVAYAVFTSGSTGTPKGVLVTMDNLMSNLMVLDEIYPTPPRSRLLQSCSQGFDVSVFEIFFTWRTGMCLCSATKDDIFNDVEDAIRQMGVTHLSLTPTVAALVNPDNVPSIKFLVVAGETLTEHVRRNWAGRGLFQGYGPSELTNICTLKPNVNVTDLINNIGPPLKNTSAFVFEPNNGCLVPAGGIGELCFGGDQVAMGYVNMPDLTASKFIKHPRYGKLYRTGDIGRILPDSSILFSSRMDDQIKIRGQRVELGEINSCILDHDAVRDCYTMLLGDEQQGESQKLITFWVPEAHATAQFSILSTDDAISSTITSLFDNMASTLPAYMIPSNLIPVKSIPMTHQSKVDRRKLIAAFQTLTAEQLGLSARNYLVTEDNEPWSDLEHRVAAALSEVLGISTAEIGRQSSFFGLGLDSISAVTLSKTLGVFINLRIPVSVILRNNSVGRLAKWVSEKLSIPVTASTEIETDVQQVFSDETYAKIRSIFRGYGKDVIKILPCTPLQEALLSAGPHTATLTYLNRMLFNVRGDIDRLNDAWAAMHQRHEILRTCFMPTEHRRFAYAQVVVCEKSLQWDELTITGDFDEQLNDYFHGVLSELADVSRPPMRLAIIRARGQTILSFCCHHALYDGGAIMRLLEEVEQFYHGSFLPEPVPFEPFLRHIVSLPLEEADQYWSTCLANFEPSSFPDLTGKPISHRKNEPHQCISKAIDIPLSSVEKNCRKLSVTLLALTQAAWAKTLSAYLGETDICFGNVVGGRNLPLDGLDRLIAPCFNTLPIRVDLSLTKQNADLLLALQNFNTESLPFQMTPLRRILQKQTSGGQHLFDSLFILQQPARELDSQVWTLRDDLGEMDFPIVCELVPHRTHDTLSFNFHYHPSVLSHEDVDLVFATYSAALKACLHHPSLEAYRISGLSSQLLSVRHEGPAAISPVFEGLLHAEFERIAATDPDIIALDFLHQDGQRIQWTFRKLNQVANQIAHTLLEFGIQLEEPVPICMPKSPFFYASILGVLKAGAAFTPIDTKLPAARKQYMLEELGARVVLSNKSTDLTWCKGASVLDAAASEKKPLESPVIDGLTSHSLAYRLYTSGSTGKPKAVNMEHRSPIQTIQCSKSIIPWKGNSKLLQYAAITFDMCYYDCFLAWSFGFTLCAADQTMMLNDLSAVINYFGATLLDLTPSVATSLLPDVVQSVEYLYCIGEAMSSELIARWGSRCVNSYGPTEAAFCCTIFPVCQDAKSTVIGSPFPSTSFTVLSKFGDFEVPRLAVGELHIGGRQLARGYHANVTLTQSRFIQKNGQCLYRTGDVVRMLRDGNFEFIGRTDDQVKIRGLRVELDEISHTLRSAHEMIKGVTVQIFRPSDDAKQQLVAFLAVGEDRLCDGSFDKGALKQVARSRAIEQLPAYMVPSFFLFVDKIPLSAAGKVDKKILKGVFCNSEELSTGGENLVQEDGVWNEIEESVRRVLSKLSATPSEQISKNTTIYQLGLDSISAVQAAAALRKTGLKATAGDILEHPTCAELAGYLQSSVHEEESESTAFDFLAFDQELRTQVCQGDAFQSAILEKIRPCTPLQAGMMAKFLQSQGKMYFNYISYDIHERIDAAKLQAAWAAVTEKHDMLRTGFAHINHPRFSFAMLTYQFSAVEIPCSIIQSTDTTAEVVHQWREDAAAEVLRSIHLPLWRVLLVQYEDAIHMHFGALHAIFDAQSLRLIMNDLVRACQGHPLSNPSQLEPALLSILSGSLTKDVMRAKFWEAQGKNMLINRFPDLSPLRASASGSAVLSKACSRGMLELEAGCRSAGISLQAAGQAAWARILSAYIGEPFVTFGVVLSGRTAKDADKAVFPCITTLPLACEVNPDNRAFLDSLIKFNASVQKYQFTPLTEIQRIAGHVDEALFDTIFAYQKISHEPIEGIPWRILDEEASADYTISVELEPTSQDELYLRITFAANILPEEQATLLLDQLDATLVDLVFNPNGRVSNANGFAPELYSITPPKDKEIECDVQLLHQFVEKSAKRHPERIAFEFATAFNGDDVVSRTWTYAQLDAAANKTAHLLLKSGIEPGNIVAVCFDKCPEASFAILGILKAGCGFLALDPNAPAARKTFIIEDSGAVSLLSMTKQLADLEDQVKVPIFNLELVSRDGLPETKPKLERDISPQDISYCLYTSGTTGTPKGCILSHENAVQAMLAFQRLFAGHWDETSRWLQFASFHFDVSVLEQYWSWSVGIRVVSAPRDLIFEDLAEAIRKLQVTHIDLTPSLARLLRPDDVPSLCRGVFITGGEALKQEILDAWGPTCVIYNGYGPTEATIGVTMYPRVPANGKPSNIGPQFDNVGSYVLQPNSEIPVLRGAVGELCVSGKLVGRGYINRTDLTTEKFPVLKAYSDRVYRTGDLVRILHNGTFDFLGRIDDQVKLRGQRLEIGEINSVIKQSSEDIQDVSTLVLKHGSHQKEQLVSFIVSRSSYQRKEKPTILLESPHNLSTVKEACQAKLPGYMVPTHFILLTSMPLSPNNKADAKALKKMYNDLSTGDLQKLSGSSNEESQDWTENEIKIREVLGGMAQVDADSIQKSSSIFELGLDSISVIGFSRELVKAGFINAAASLIMKNSRISQLGKVLNYGADPAFTNQGSIIAAKQEIAACQHRHRKAAVGALRMDQSEIESIAPCSPLQQGIISRASQSREPMYFGTFHFTLANNIDLLRLRHAWKKVVSSVQILRTFFVPTVEGFVQVAARQFSLPWNEYLVSDAEDLEPFLARRRYKWWRQNIEVFKRPFEVFVSQVPGRRLMSVHLFHALYDGSSLPLIFEKVMQEYHKESDIEYGPPFQSLLAYGPLRQVEGSEHFWTRYLQHAQFKSCPRLTTQPIEQDTVASMELTDLQSFENTRRALGVTDQAIIQACWSASLLKHFVQVVTIGMVISGRSIELEGADSAIGPLFNTIPFYLHFNKDNSWATIVQRCHDFNTAALSFQHTALRDIMKWTKRTPTEPFFDTLFVFQKQTRKSDRSMSNELWKLIKDGAQADYPLAFEAEQRENGSLKVTVVAQGHISDQQTSIGLLKTFQQALLALLDGPESLVEDVVGVIPETSADSTGSTATTDSPDTSGFHEFDWNGEAKMLREEIAALANISAMEVNESTSIFELGLDSIDAIKLSSRLKKRGVDVPVSVIMRGLTIPKIMQQVSGNSFNTAKQAEQTLLLDRQRKLEQYFQRSRLDSSNIESVLPVTPLQEAMVAEMLSSNFKRYFNHDVLKLAPSTDVEQLKGAWMTVVKNSPILRTSFSRIDDPDDEASFAQLVHKPWKFAWPQIEISKEEEIPEVLEKIRVEAGLLCEDAVHFKLTQLRSPTGNYLVLTIAHALYDGWSLGLLHDDARRAYLGRYEARQPYNKILEEILSASGPDAHMFWRDFLSGSQIMPFPRKELGEWMSENIIHRREQRSSISVARLRSFSKRCGITLQAIGQTCWSFVLASYLRNLEVIFGVVLSGRDSSDANVLFPAMNTVATRSILHGSRREMLQYMQENINSIRQYQHFPLRKAQALAQTSGQALFDTLFIYQRRPDTMQDEQVSLYKSIGGASDVEYPVCVEMETVDNTLIWRCACKNIVLDEKGTEEVLARLDQALENIVDAPDRPVLDVKEAGISICGLLPFQSFEAKKTSNGQHESSKTNGTLNGSGSWSSTEKIIRQVLSSVSKIPEAEISRDLTMFHLGLDSISAIKVSSLLRKQSIKLSVSEMLRAGTVARMAQLVDERKQTALYSPSDGKTVIRDDLKSIDCQTLIQGAGIPSNNVQEVLPATAGQVYMLSVWQNSTGALFYPEFTYRIRGSVETETIRDAWGSLIERNSILRTIFVATGQEDIPFIQVVTKRVQECFVAPDQQISPSQQQPFVSLRVKRVGDDLILKLAIHHALYDGVSLPQLAQQLELLCNDAHAPATSPRAFTDLIALTASESAREKRKSFWTRYLSGLSQTCLTQPDASKRRRTEVFKPKVLSDMGLLEEASRKYGLSIQSFFLAAYAKIYAGLTGSPADVVYGIYLANRSHAVDGLSDLAAPTVNLVPLRVRSAFCVSLKDSAAQIQEDLRQIGSAENSAVGLWEIEKWTGLKIDSFVNFLKLPDIGDESDAAEKTYGDKKVRIEEAMEGRENTRSLVVEAPDSTFEEPQEVQNNLVRDRYLHSLDIEATVKNGSLSIGVFSLEEMLPMGAAEKLCGDMRKLLAELE